MKFDPIIYDGNIDNIDSSGLYYNSNEERFELISYDKYNGPRVMEWCIGTGVGVYHWFEDYKHRIRPQTKRRVSNKRV